MTTVITRRHIIRRTTRHTTRHTTRRITGSVIMERHTSRRTSRHTNRHTTRHTIRRRWRTPWRHSPTLSSSITGSVRVTCTMTFMSVELIYFMLFLAKFASHCVFMIGTVWLLQPEMYAAEPRPTTYLCFSVFVCLCCNWLIGLIAIIFSCKWHALFKKAYVLSVRVHTVFSN